MSCRSYHIELKEKGYSDKNEELVLELHPESDEVLAIPASGYTVLLNNLPLANSATITDGIITVAAIVPKDTFAVGSYRDGILYPNTDDGTEYFEVTFTANFYESNS